VLGCNRQARERVCGLIEILHQSLTDSPSDILNLNHVVIVLIEMFGTRQPMVLQELQVFLSRWILDNNNILVVISFGC